MLQEREGAGHSDFQTLRHSTRDSSFNRRYSAPAALANLYFQEAA